MTQIKLEEVNIDDLCDDRPLSTNEIFNGNAFYGVDRVLKEYTGLPASYSDRKSVV